MIRQLRSLVLLAIVGAACARPAVAADAPAAKKDLNFTRDIAPVMLQNCAACHRPGQIGPFPLLTYDDAKKRAKQIADVTASGYMPPWHANSHGEFANERRLTPEQIALFKDWSDAGAPEGDPNAMPAPPSFASGWALGRPDLIGQAQRPYMLEAEGGDVYRYFVIKTGFTEDKYISAIDFKPGNPKIVHHIIAFLDLTGTARAQDSLDGQSGYGGDVRGGTGFGFIPSGMLGGWAPGNLPEPSPDGVGILIPKGADIVLPIHYHKDGKVEKDQTQIGLYMCKKPVEKRLRVMPVVGWLNIPPGDNDYVVRSYPFPVFYDMSVVDVMPHMHLLGKSMAIHAHVKGGDNLTLIDVPKWDFNWQATYQYKAPVKLPAGSSVSLVAHYDNSTANPNNPNSPPRQIHWGEETKDEMALGFVWFTYDQENIPRGQKITDVWDQVMGLNNGGVPDFSGLRKLFGGLGSLGGAF